MIENDKKDGKLRLSVNAVIDQTKIKIPAAPKYSKPSAVPHKITPTASPLRTAMSSIQMTLLMKKENTKSLSPLRLIKNRSESLVGSKTPKMSALSKRSYKF